MLLLFLLAALVSLLLVARRPFRHRRLMTIAWALLPTWMALGCAALLFVSAQGESGVFVGWFIIAIFQPIWLIAVLAGAALGLVIARIVRPKR